MASPSVREERLPAAADAADRLLPGSWRESRRFVPRTFVQPTIAFLRMEAAGGLVMLAAAVLAVALANTSAGDTYFAVLEARVEVVFGGFRFRHLSGLTVREWVNDGLMVVFFFVVGLEIKRELAVGDLADRRAAALPALSAVGGMLVPAALYLWLNTLMSGATGGWGIPMATDIAFAVGVMALAGRRVPVHAKLFLLALAIVDDLGAILVIALFYTAELAGGWLVAALGGLAVIRLMRRIEVRSVAAYVIVGGFVWLAVLESGVHATVAGVALALLTPVRSFYSPREYPRRARALVARVESYLPEGTRDLTELDRDASDRVQTILRDMRRLSRESIPPLERLEHGLARWATFGIVPLFAFANAGVRVSSEAIAGASSDPVLLGVAVGLLVGKAAGVTGAAWLAVRLGLGRLPQGTTWSHMVGIGLLAGIGFTVALFVSTLSFPAGSGLQDSAKLGIFAASIVAGAAGFAWLRFVAPDASAPRAFASGPTLPTPPDAY